MNLKRLLSTILGLPVVVLILAIGNKYVIDIAFAIVAGISLHEYFNAIKIKANPITGVGYLSIILIALIHIIPRFNISYVGFFLPMIVAILFSWSIFTEMKYNIIDVSLTLLGICYVVIFTMCIPLINAIIPNKIYLWFIIIAAWGTDIFAYLIGKVFKLGKHKFSKISPNKTIEGCIAGTVGALIVSLIYIFICNKFLNAELSYVFFSCLTVFLSIISQIGDFVASSIKRYVDIKDFGNLIPGHGGMLDRIDSVIFIAPFAYLLYMIIF
jgi:phosphatidate cytidylyltransferase